MGLDITVYQKIKLATQEEIENSNYDFTAFVIEESWKDRVKNLEYDKHYTGVPVYGFQCAYSSHSWFRDHLANLTQQNLNWKTEPCTPNTPFYELINFADNEGVIDFETSKKLYEDFISWRGKAYESNDERFINYYDEWTEIFNHAKENGVVDFH